MLLAGSERIPFSSHLRIQPTLARKQFFRLKYCFQPKVGKPQSGNQGWECSSGNHSWMSPWEGNQLMKRANCIYWEKKSTYKRTHAIQTHVVRGSTAYVGLELFEVSGIHWGVFEHITQGKGELL